MIVAPNPRGIHIDDYDYPLPEKRIARHPLAQRDQCLLLVRDYEGRLSTHRFYELPQLLPADSLLVYNNTRVINARLRFRKGEDHQGATVEVFCLEPVVPADYERSFAATGVCQWQCFIGNAKRWGVGAQELTMPLPDGSLLRAQRLGCEGNARGGSSTVEFRWDNPGMTFSDVISAAGVIPIPPYLNRDTEASDATDYQTVYSRIKGSVAAPTAGLHFTPEVLEAIDGRGIPRREVTLHVGAGTFKPVSAESIGDHPMHSEFFLVPRALVEELATTDRKVVAVGTTSVRTLESLYHAGCLMSVDKWDGEVPQWWPYDASHPRLTIRQAMEAVLSQMGPESPSMAGATRLLIAPGYRYRVVQGMVTNFHQPRSTLLLLVGAMIGEEWRRMYRYALDDSRYRFLSYGDSCLLL